MTSEREVPEREALRRLPREASPSPELEERVVAAVRSAGLLEPPRSRRVRWGSVAAALVVFAAGWLARGWVPRPGVPPPRVQGGLYLLLLSPLPGEPDTAVEARRVEEYRAWAQRLRQERRLVRAEKLGGTARLVTAPGRSARAPAGGRARWPSGFFLVRADSVEDAVSVAESCPHLRHGGSIVVRSVDPT